MTDAIKGYVIGVLLVALALSGIANFFLFTGYTGQRDKAATLKGALDRSVEVAGLCSESVVKLEKAGKAQASAAKAAIAKAAAVAQTHNVRADEILSKPPAAPGDDCKSATVAVDDWLAGRRK